MKEELETRWRELGEFIRAERQLGHVSLRKLSDMAGISNPYLSQIERGLRKPSAEILQQIAKALHISAETLYVRAGILEARDDDDDVVHSILCDMRLSEVQKQTLLRVYQSFVHENGHEADVTATAATAAATAEPPVPAGAEAPAVADPEPTSAA